MVVPARGKSTVQSSVTGPVKVASRGRHTRVGANLNRSIHMQPRDTKPAELYLVKRKAKKRLLLIKTCFKVIKLLVQLFALIDKYWSKIADLL